MIAAVFLVAVLVGSVAGFSPTGRPGHYLAETSFLRSELQSASTTEATYPVITAVVAPLVYIGPYSCLSLRFPQYNRTLTFLLDSGANVNTINASLVDELNLPLCWTAVQADASVGIGGQMSPGDTYNLGECQLDGLPPEQSITFMSNLTAAAFSYASPVGDGLLGTSFFWRCPGGAEFDWVGTDGDPPTMIFYVLPTAANTTSMARVDLESVVPTGLVLLNVTLNGVTIPAILDTGSPITVISRKAADSAGIKFLSADDVLSKPPPEALARHSPPRVGDDSLVVGGIDGTPMYLRRSKEEVSIQACTCNDTGVSFGSGFVYVGDLPVMDLLGKTSKPPMVVLGLDFLQRTYRMLLQLQQGYAWFEEVG